MTHDVMQAKREQNLPEIQEMLRTRLFTNPEVRDIQNARQKFELELSKSARLDTYKKYIEFENNVLKKVQERRRKKHITEKKSDIDYRIRRRIRHLYELAMQKYADDDVLCLSYFNFARQKNITAAADSAVLTLIKRHACRPKAWIVSAKYYANDKNDIDLALQTLEKGRAYHKDNGHIYKEAISLEITKALGKNTIAKEEDNELDKRKATCVERILLYIDEMFANIKDCNFYIDLLKYLEDHPFTIEIQKRIVNFILTEYKGEPLVWQMIAQREWKGFHLEPQQSNSSKTRLTQSVAKYREGIGAIEDDEKKKELFKQFADFLIELMQDHLGAARQLKKTYFKEACENACEKGFLEEHHYVQWFDLAENYDKEHVLEQATKFLPESLELWKLRLQYMFINTKNKENIDQVFRLGIRHLQEKALPLWLAIIRFKCIYASNREVNSIYLEASKQSQQVSSFILPQYMEWLSLNEGIEKARMVYKERASDKPYNKQLHLKMAKLESCEIDPDFDEWEKVHKNACDQFGDEDEDVWIRYIDYLRSDFRKSKDKDKDMETMKDLCKKAESRLPLPSQIDFRNKLKELNIQFDV